MKSELLQIFDFSKSDEGRKWRSIDDVVMGGVSTSEFWLSSAGTGIFQGILSLEHGGGFASVRSRTERMDLRGYDGLEIRVRGDGKWYRLRLYTDSGLDGVAYQANFGTGAEEWRSIRLPFGRFRATRRGRDVPGAPPLDIGNITSFGWMIADGQAGRFRLEVAWMRAYPERAP
jgi:monofunctional biosynthetic peptidoglycan transglycosylase